MGVTTRLYTLVGRPCADASNDAHEATACDSRLPLAVTDDLR